MTPTLVYVAGPFSATTREGVERNIAAAVQVGIQVAKLGAFPVVPHANTAHPDYETVQPYTFWIAGTTALLRGCQALLLMTGWENSSGALGEKSEAERLGRPVFHSLEELGQWLRAIELLSSCNRSELRDQVFGDAEIYWERNGVESASGYCGERCSVSIRDGENHAEFDGAFAVPLLKLGTLTHVERNDSDDREDIEF